MAVADVSGDSGTCTTDDLGDCSSDTGTSVTDPGTCTTDDLGNCITDDSSP